MDKVKKIVGWVLSGLIALILCASAFQKISGNEQALQMGASFGLSAGVYSLLGMIEILSVVLFLYTRTGILGALLLVAYFGGSIATHLEHHLSTAFPIAIEAVIWITCIIRFPELTQRIWIKGSKTNNLS